jgi:hypothetical protein
MAGKKGYSGPPGNANAFRHGLAAVQRRRSEGALTPDEQDIRADILAGLIADKGGDQQIGIAERILAEVISSDVALLVTFNQAIDGVLKGQVSVPQCQIDANRWMSVYLVTFNLGVRHMAKNSQESRRKSDGRSRVGPRSLST